MWRYVCREDWKIRVFGGEHRRAELSRRDAQIRPRLGKRSCQCHGRDSPPQPHLRKYMQLRIPKVRGRCSKDKFLHLQIWPHVSSSSWSTWILVTSTHPSVAFVCQPAVRRRFTLRSKCKWENTDKITVLLCILTKYPFCCNCQPNICAN